MLRRVFKAFQYRDFRLMWIGACTSTIGTFMQVFAQGWLIYNLSHSAFLLALDQVLQATPIFLFSLIGGVIADRFERRHLLMGSQWVQMGCATLLTLLVGFHAIRVWHMLACSFVAGFAQAFGGPAYQALIPNLVEKEDVPNAISLMSIQFNAAVLVGPALGGLAFAKLGATWCFGLNALSFLAPVVALGHAYSPIPAGQDHREHADQPEAGNSVHSRAGGHGGTHGSGFLHGGPGGAQPDLPAGLRQGHLPSGARTPTRCSSRCSGAGSIVGALTVAGLGNLRKKGRVALIDDDLPGSLHRRVRAFAFHPAVLRHAVLLGRLHDFGLHHGELAGAAHRHQRDARAA